MIDLKDSMKDGVIAAHPGSIPSTPVIWPADRHQSNQIQQTKISAKPRADFVLPSTQPSASSVAPRTTPAPVSNVRVILRPSSGQKTVHVQFAHPSGDPHFQGASVYLKKGNQQPTLVASGAKSPLTFTVPNDPAPHAVYVSSDGPWGSTNILTSPSHPLRLR